MAKKKTTKKAKKVVKKKVAKKPPQPTKKAEKKEAPKKRRLPVGKIFLWTGVVLGVGIFSIVFMFFALSANLPPVEEIDNQQVSQATKIFDRTGEVKLYEIHGAQKRTNVPLDEIPDYIKEATISIEDANFYNNPGFDLRGLFRGVILKPLSGERAQGGSTITQQLAKNAFLTPERTITRKIKELVLAWRLEDYYTKDEILELYLNQVPYGSNAYGIEAASQLYFDKSVRWLDLNESAMLAAMTKAPTYYSPRGKNFDELITRKNMVLERMNELGYITTEEMTAAQNAKLDIATLSTSGIKAPHFVIYIQEYLNQKYGEGFVKSAGLEVITTLDWELEQLAEEVIKSGAERNTELYKGRNAALVALDPKTGQILSMVGSADYFDIENEGNFNVAVKGLRQPGSAFKPFAYMTAFQKGFTPDTLLWDVETEFNTTNNPQNSYKPGNFDEVFIGPVRMKDALAQSINIPAAKTLYLAGIEDTIQNVEKMGITTLKYRSRFGLSLVLGGGEVKLIELVGAYGVFATEGIRNPITPILKITDKYGDVIEEFKPAGSRVLDPQYPRLINDILSDSKLRAPLFSSSFSLTQVPGYQVALKTGTTNNYVDAWTMGYTPNLVVGVWAGNNHREPLQKSGGSILAAVPMWHGFFSKAAQKYEVELFTKPEPVTSEIPFLRGELDVDGNHSILFHLNKANDSQFKNWEDGISNWLLFNTPDYSMFSGPDAVAQNGILLDINTPQNGEEISGGVINIDFSASSDSLINRIDVLLNNMTIESRTGDFGENITYQNSVSAQNLKTQNLLEIKVFNSESGEASESMILYAN